MADGAAALALPDDFAAGYARLVAEAGALFGSRPYRSYTWIVSLSDHVAHFGLEHHESSDDRDYEATLSEPDRRMELASLLGHEYVHAWNGKFRRPQGLLSPDYQKPMDGSLLWVYEGLTEFWGDVLAARAGLETPERYREYIADVTAEFTLGTGARWRPMGDTAVAAQVLYGAPSAWQASRRGVDYYDASVFLWLDVEQELRARSGGKRGLDDFCRRFYAAPTGVPQLKPYGEDEVLATLAAVAPNDWHAFIHRHLDVPGTAALEAALARAGWRLAYSPEKSNYIETRQKVTKNVERQWSIGFKLDKDGKLIDVIDDSAAAHAGAAPGTKLIGVNGRKFTTEILDAAIADAQSSHRPIELLLESDEFFRTLSVAYDGGPRYPHLVAIDGRPDGLAAIIAPRRP
jgi:predicted metalloprotease with PDZ domain